MSGRESADWKWPQVTDGLFRAREGSDSAGRGGEADGGGPPSPAAGPRAGSEPDCAERGRAGEEGEESEQRPGFPAPPSQAHDGGGRWQGSRVGSGPAGLSLGKSCGLNPGHCLRLVQPRGGVHCTTGVSTVATTFPIAKNGQTAVVGKLFGSPVARLVRIPLVRSIPQAVRALARGNRVLAGTPSVGLWPSSPLWSRPGQPAISSVLAFQTPGCDRCCSAIC